ncbi:MAG TPA: tannase/feruloyl esterase family alpha/beta hydrolase [Casimicrobiaceae bacterium]|jgi:feruloyl esterase|nr:tannase/feruloyl esterase family alpha/beta hydrolase [Casimicrobiaceae bacterium]
MNNFLRQLGDAMRASRHATWNATLALALLGLGSQAYAAQSCESLATLSLSDTLITLAQTVPAGSFLPPDALPGTGTAIPTDIPFPFCRVAGVLSPTPDSQIRFEVWLPVGNNWNGKLNHGGSGAYGGSLSPAEGYMVQGLLRGYAVTGTDMGHVASITSGSWALGHPEKIADWGWRANHVTSVTAKAIIEAFYGTAPRVSYFTGCSDGGHEALMEAQRFPDDYDGIVAGASANYWTHQSAAWVSETRANTDDPASKIPGAKLPLITQAAVAACPGVLPSFIDDPTNCSFDPASLQCSAGDEPTCLTAAQVEAVRKIYAGPHNPRTAEEIYPGLEPGSEIYWGAFLGPNVFLGADFYKYFVFNDPNWNFHTLDFDHDIAYADAKMQSIIDSTNPNLSAFKARGSKLIIYHGWADSLVNPMNSVNYFESVVATERPGNGRGVGEDRVALRRAQEYVRLFMVPGMAHCGLGGVGLNTFDSLSAIEDWVERGIAPDSLEASHTTLLWPIDVSTQTAGDFSRPVCAYPKVAKWTGRGSPADAVNFVCE